jgi:chemotaxis signal transduction protein
MVIEKDAIQPAKDLIELPLSVIDGVFQHKGRLIILLSLERLFTGEALQLMTEAVEYKNDVRVVPQK